MSSVLQDYALMSHLNDEICLQLIFFSTKENKNKLTNKKTTDILNKPKANL